jgi:hypothetical protein
LFYHNREDERLVVSCPYSLSFSLNMASKRSVGAFVMLMVILALCLGHITGMAVDEFNTHSIKLPADGSPGGAVKINSKLYKKTIPLHEIVSVGLFDELPRIRQRSSGFDSPLLKRGVFNLDGHRNAGLMVYVNVTPVIYIETFDGVYFYNERTAMGTIDVYNKILLLTERLQVN